MASRVNDLRRSLDDWSGSLDDIRNCVRYCIRLSNGNCDGFGDRDGNRVRDRYVNIVCYGNGNFVWHMNGIWAVNGNRDRLVNRDSNWVRNVNGVGFGDVNCYGMRYRNMNILVNWYLVRLRNGLSVLAGDVCVSVFGDLNWS